MAFTQQNLADFEAAIMELATGAEEVTINNRRWRKSSLKHMRETYEWMKTEVASTGGSTILRGSFKRASNQDTN